MPALVGSCTVEKARLPYACSQFRSRHPGEIRLSALWLVKFLEELLK